MSRYALVAGTILLQLHVAVNADDCVAPGSCSPPGALFSRVIRGPNPSLQWNINGGFCGAFSLQQAALAFGAWISQDFVRKANADQEGDHYMHGDSVLGYEVMPSNVAYTAEHLKLTYDEWDYNAPAPQADAFKGWVKGHVANGEPVAFFPMCKGDGNACYNLSCPGDPAGVVDHVEPIFGVFSNHSLDDTTAYPEDVIVHMSDQDLKPYYRALSTLEDTSAMDGNCADAQPGFGKNEMYPCFDEDVTYGLAVTGLAITEASSSSPTLFPVSVVVDTVAEPDVRRGESSVPLHASVQVTGLSATSGSSYALYRFGSTADLPSTSTDLDTSNFEHRTLFTPEDGQDTWTFEDPDSFESHSATYYVATTYPSR